MTAPAARRQRWTPGEVERKRTNEADSASHYCIPVENTPLDCNVIVRAPWLGARRIFGEGMKRPLLLLLLCCSLLACAANKPAPVASSAAPQSGGATWKFAISGDSRNCGDVAMPAIAANAHAQGVAFYWHLGDLRWMSNIDEDIAHRAGRPVPSLEQYHGMAWQDFIDQQLHAWGSTPVFLGIGNHELYGNKTRADFL